MLIQESGRWASNGLGKEEQQFQQAGLEEEQELRTSHIPNCVNYLRICAFSEASRAVPGPLVPEVYFEQQRCRLGTLILVHEGSEKTQTLAFLHFLIAVLVWCSAFLTLRVKLTWMVPIPWEFGELFNYGGVSSKNFNKMGNFWSIFWNEWPSKRVDLVSLSQWYLWVQFSVCLCLSFCPSIHPHTHVHAHMHINSIIQDYKERRGMQRNVSEKMWLASKHCQSGVLVRGDALEQERLWRAWSRGSWGNRCAWRDGTPFDSLYSLKESVCVGGGGRLRGKNVKWLC